MFRSIFSGFSVPDLEQAKTFYGETLGLKVNDSGAGLELQLPNGSSVFMYPKNNHEPATFTILNFVVDDIDAAVHELTKKGVQFNHYQDMPTDEHGILRGLSSNQGPDIAWFNDPFGNILSVLQTQ